MKNDKIKKVNVIIAAGGTSQRFGVENKLFEPCGTSCVLVEAIKPFLRFEEISRVIVAIEPSYSDELLNILGVQRLDEDSRIKLTVGGSSRTETVKQGLHALEDDCDIVLVHDGARPYVTEKLIREVIDGAQECGAAVALRPLTDALVSLKNNVTPQNRENYRLVQTPAGFDKNRIVSAYSKASKPFFDDISVVQKYAGGEIKIVNGDRRNVKITLKEDLKTPLTGCGYDVHRLKEGDGIKLNGEFIPCPFSFTAHSDGDVPVHAIMDAILTAIGEKDIGHLFPVDDERYDDADSMLLLGQVIETAKQKNYRPINVSVCIIAEKPFIAPYIDKMRSNLSRALGIPMTHIGISATTNEKVGDIGNGEAIAAYATVLLQ